MKFYSYKQIVEINMQLLFLIVILTNSFFQCMTRVTLQTIPAKSLSRQLKDYKAIAKQKEDVKIQLTL